MCVLSRFAQLFALHLMMPLEISLLTKELTMKGAWHKTSKYSAKCKCKMLFYPSILLPICTREHTFFLIAIILYAVFNKILFTGIRPGVNTTTALWFGINQGWCIVWLSCGCVYSGSGYIIFMVSLLLSLPPMSIGIHLWTSILVYIKHKGPKTHWPAYYIILGNCFYKFYSGYHRH